MNKKLARLRRARKTRLKIKELMVNRLVVHKSNCHIYAQIIDQSGTKVLVSASTMSPEIIKEIKNGANIASALLVGQLIAKKATAQGLANISFDRSGFRYHGRVKALADAARENGLVF